MLIVGAVQNVVGFVLLDYTEIFWLGGIDTSDQSVLTTTITVGPEGGRGFCLFTASFHSSK